MFLILQFAGLMLFLVLVVGNVWTFRRARALPSPWWTRAVASAVVLGAVTGFVGGVVVRWRPTEDLEYVGFPIPGMLLHWEDGRWVDYVSPLVMVSTFLNSLIGASVFVLPLSVAILIRSWRSAKPSPPSV